VDPLLWKNCGWPSLLVESSEAASESIEEHSSAQVEAKNSILLSCLCGFSKKAAGLLIGERVGWWWVVTEEEEFKIWWHEEGSVGVDTPFPPLFACFTLSFFSVLRIKSK
jgi:hypothetical protein